MVSALRHCAMALVAVAWILARISAACAAERGATEGAPAALTLEAKIPLGDIRGRIDHLAIDIPRQRLYVAELGNDSVGVVDLKAGKTTRTLTGLREPQGIGYVPTTDAIYIANAGDGSVRVFRAADLASLGQIALGSDADNVRVNKDGSRVFVGYGDGALAVIDPRTQSKVAEIGLKAHPESFRLESAGSRIFVNVPDAHAIAVVDAVSKQQVANWSTGNLRSNYPLALDGSGRVLAVFRHPSRVGVFDSQDGRLLSSVDTCSDSDDVFIDAKRARLYVICGEGFVDIFSQNKDQLLRIARLATAGGARTGLFVPEMDRLYVAERAGFGRPAAIWVLQPVP
jgi:DNA-binding beta-propeller fold protein YncE